jgi:hypothetical protein
MKQTNAPSVSGLLAGDVRHIRASHSLDSLEAVRPFVPHIIPSGVLPDTRAPLARRSLHGAANFSRAVESTGFSRHERQAAEALQRAMACGFFFIALLTHQRPSFDMVNHRLRRCRSSVTDTVTRLIRIGRVTTTQG